MMSPSLAIRVDGNAQIGMGHLMRCRSLAERWRRSGGEVAFILGDTAPAFQDRMRDEGFGCLQISASSGSAEDAMQTSQCARQLAAAWIVVDGYHFDGTYQRRLKEAGLRIVVLDDYGHAEHYYADFVLNQNLSAEAAIYSRREPYTQLLLGCRYTLLRQQFLSWLSWVRPISTVARKILVTLGGSDPHNATGKVIQALRRVQMDGLETVIVVGGSNPHFEALQSDSRNLRCAVRVVRDAPNMPELMAWADVAIAAGGSTSWELAFMGLPTVTLILADNQAAIARSLQQQGVAVNLGPVDEVAEDRIIEAVKTLLCDTALRQTMSEKGRCLVDGLGSDRVAKAMSEALI